MTSIPLLCTICPRQPDFSDLSHLLTHVSSKAHLFNYNRAVLRRHQEEIRQQLDVYDGWYTKHEIEQLLSQRMSAKDSKKSSRTQREPSNSVRPPKQTRMRKKRVTGSPTPEPGLSPVKTEHAIDPRLPQSKKAPDTGLGLPFTYTNPDPSSNHQIFVPRMSEWQVDSHRTQEQSGYFPRSMSLTRDPDGLASHDDPEQDCFQSFIQSPIRTSYPDPSQFSTSNVMDTPFPSDEQPSRTQKFPGRALFQDDDKNLGNDEAEPNRSPVLKGIRWPGMSLFDSASLDAQRLRNQKKDESILEQMENNSVSVEQMEDIYWPDGTLKKRRMITGNVESSPSSQASPVPKRRRAKNSRPRNVLTDVSINLPVVPKKRYRRPKREPGSRLEKELSADQNMPRVPPQAHPQGRRKYRTAASDSEEIERKMTRGPTRRGFTVFEDSTEGNHANRQQLPTQERRPFDGGAENRFVACKASHVLISDESPASPFWYRQPQTHTSISATSKDQENIQPCPESRHTIIDDHAAQFAPERLTQRYFSIVGNNEPQFFDTMPPQMDFGGMAGPRYRGSCLNPLNPQFRQSRHAMPYAQTMSPHLTSSEAVGSRPLHLTTGSSSSKLSNANV